MHKNLFFILSFFLCFLIAFPNPARAHMLKTNGSVGAIIHVDPEDDPYVGVPSNIFFELKDKEGKFTPENCRCVVDILKGEETLDSFLLFGNGEAGLDHPSSTYTFPEKGIYTIKLTGTPKQEGQFEPFTLTYDVRVARESQTKNLDTSDSAPATPRFGIVIGIGVLALGGLAFGAYIRNHRKQKGVV